MTRHFGESIFLARHLFPRERRESTAVDSHGSPDARFAETSASRNQLGTEILRVLDIGSGAGFPGLPLKIWAPEIGLTLVESNHKKAAFLREVIRVLTFTNVDVLATRAENLLPAPDRSGTSAGTRGSEDADALYDIVTLRAVERFETVLPIAARLVRPGGRLAMLIGSGQMSSLEPMAAAFQIQPPISLPHSQSSVVQILVRLP